MKKKILNNFTLKLLSIFFAIVLWLVVMNISDYSITVEIDDVPVQKLNGDVLEELDKIYDVAKGDTVDIIVKGRRSVVSGLSAEDFNATADLSTMSITNSVQIYVTPKNGALIDELSITCVDNTMILNLEEKVSLQFSVKVKTFGAVKNNYAVCETQASPNIITVEGPRSAVEKITEAVVSVDVSHLGETTDIMAQVKLYDAYGEEINNDRITLSHDQVKVSVKVYPVKEVPVTVNVKGTPKEGYGLTEVIYQPLTILVAGEPELLEEVEEITIDNVVISGLDSDLETTVSIKDNLPTGIYNAEASDEIVITANIEKLVEKEFKLESSDVTLLQRSQDRTYEVTFSDDFYIEAVGLNTVMKDIDIERIKPSIMCGDLSLGNHSNVELELAEIEGVTYNINGTVTLSVSSK